MNLEIPHRLRQAEVSEAAEGCTCLLGLLHRRLGEAFTLLRQLVGEAPLYGAAARPVCVPTDPLVRPEGQRRSPDAPGA